MYEVLLELTDTDHYLVVAKVRERLAVSKQAAQKLAGERFISGSQMSWRLGKSIRLRFQTGLEVWRT